MAVSPLVPILEEALNRYLALDPRTPERLAQLSGRAVQLDVVGFPGPLFLSFPGGAVHLASDCAGAPDVTLRGAPFSLLRLALTRDGERLLFDGEVELRGDSGVLQTLRACLADRDVDWEEEVAKRLGDIPAHALANQARAVAAWLGQGRESLGLDVQDYLWEEGRLLPRPEAVEAFLAQVDTLRDDAERLAKRVERLAARLDRGPAA